MLSKVNELKISQKNQPNKQKNVPMLWTALKRMLSVGASLTITQDIFTENIFTYLNSSAFKRKRAYKAGICLDVCLFSA